MTETIETGTDYIRAALAARAKKIGYTNRARDWGISSEALLGFIEGRTDLSPQVLCVIATDLWGGNAEYDPALNLLRPTNRNEPRSMGVAPAPFDPEREILQGPPSWRPWMRVERTEPVPPSLLARPIKKAGWAK
jgi:hypothetical protein